MISRENLGFRSIYRLSIAAIALLFALSLYVWTRNAVSSGRGEPGQFLMVFAIPILLAVIVGSLPVFARIEPRKLHIAQSRKALTSVWAVLLLFFVVIHITLLLDVLGRKAPITAYWPVLAGLVCVVMGNYLGKIQSNNIAGFRTPWTLSSELSWNKTHRFGGKLLVLLGVILIAGSVLIVGDFWVYFLLVSSLLWTVVLFIYSYVVWKRDTETGAELPLQARYVHTNLIARDWRALARFYEAVFGCERVPPERDLAGPAMAAGTGLPDAHLRGVHLRLPGWGRGGPTLELFSYERLAEGTAPAVNRPGFGHLAFSVDNVAAARAAVLAAGGRAVGEVVTVTVADGRRVTWCYVTDPEGNILELQSWSE